MSLRRTVAAAFRQRGTDALADSEFVVALSLDRGWFSPDQAQRLLDVAIGEGVLVQDGDTVTPGFDLAAVTIPDGFEPEEDVLRERSTFERVLDTLVDAGLEKQAAVGGINRLQDDLRVSIEAAAIVYARRDGIAVDDLADRALDGLREGD